MPRRVLSIAVLLAAGAVAAVAHADLPRFPLEDRPVQHVPARGEGVIDGRFVTVLAGLAMSALLVGVAIAVRWSPRGADGATDPEDESGPLPIAAGRFTEPIRDRPVPDADPARGRVAFLAIAAGTAVAAALLVGWAPIGVSIVTVFLFAGPHNWFEARYLLERMPPRWGRLRPYFLTGLLGAAGLSAAYVLLVVGLRSETGFVDRRLVAIAAWNTLLLGWILVLILLRQAQPPRREWGWTVPVVFLLMAGNWIWPEEAGLVLVYAHPLVALWFLDRLLRQRRPGWVRTYRGVLLLVPVLLSFLWLLPGDEAVRVPDDPVSVQVLQHAGAAILPAIPSRLLVATHAFLELLHYGVWIVAVPLAISVSAPWRTDGIPLVRRARWGRSFVVGVPAAGGLLVACLCGGFLTDYSLTRDVYFTVAILHVLAEIPFLLRLL